MYADQLYTPNKYRGSQHDTRKDKSMTFSHIKSHKSTEAGTHSPYRSSNVSKLEEARKNIDTVICDMEDLRDVNQSAFREVKSVNSDVLEEFRKTYTFDQENVPAYSEHNYRPRSTYQPSGHSQRMASQPQEDSNSLRGMLNQEMKKNSNLLMQMSRMEDENRMAKQQGGHYEVRELQQENERLRRNLAEVSQLPQEIFSEIENLKRENNQLRKDTVRILKKVDHF